MVQKITTEPPIRRIETGALQINNDWPGLFIRGDRAAHLSLCINTVLSLLESPASNMSTASAIGELKALQRIIQGDVIVRPSSQPYLPVKVELHVGDDVSVEQLEAILTHIHQQLREIGRADLIVKTSEETRG